MTIRDDKKSVGGSDGRALQQMPSKQMPGESDVREIPIEKIRVGAFCHRKDCSQGIDLLAESIDRQGLLQYPIVAEDADGNFTLVCGSRRYNAYKKLGRQTIPCLVRRMTPQARAVAAFTENSEREELDPVQEARKLKQMKDVFGLKDEDLAEEVGWPQSVVAERLSILRLNEKILEKIDTRPESHFKFTHALALSKLAKKDKDGEKKQVDRDLEIHGLLSKTIEHRLTTTDVKEYVRLILSGAYDLLSDNLQTLMMKSKAMTPRMARLYLEPEMSVEGNDTTAERLRDTAKQLDKKEIEKLVVKAVHNESSYERTKQKLLSMIHNQFESASKQEAEPKSSYRKLIDDISALHNRLKANGNAITDLAQSVPAEIEEMCGQIRRLVSQFEQFLESAETALAERKLKEST